MLIISRKDSESIVIEPIAHLDPDLTLIETLRNWQIEIVIFWRKQSQTKIGIDRINRFLGDIEGLEGVDIEGPVGDAWVSPAALAKWPRSQQSTEQRARYHGG